MAIFVCKDLPYTMIRKHAICMRKKSFIERNIPGGPVTTYITTKYTFIWRNGNWRERKEVETRFLFTIHGLYNTYISLPIYIWYRTHTHIEEGFFFSFSSYSHTHLNVKMFQLVRSVYDLCVGEDSYLYLQFFFPFFCLFICNLFEKVLSHTERTTNIYHN